MSINNVDPLALNPREFAQLVKRASADELRRLMHSDRRAAVLEDIFTGMPGVFRADRAEAVHAVIHWNIGDRPDGGMDTYEVVIAGGTCQVSARPEREPRLSLSIGVVDFVRMVTGNASPTMLFMRGKMKVKGDLGLAAKFPYLFDIPPA